MDSCDSDRVETGVLPASMKKQSPILTRRWLLLGGVGLAAVGSMAAGVDRLVGASGSFGLVGGTEIGLIGPNSPRVLAVGRARASTGTVLRRTLRAQPTTLDLGGRQFATWGFDGSVPAAEIRVTSGDELEVDVRNELPSPTTVHWHGLALRNDMDGVPGVTMAAIEPGDTFLYQFIAPHPGTYWFHPHVGVQLETGLMGPLVIEDPREPLSYDQDVTLVLDDWTDGLGQAPDDILAGQAANGMSGMGGMAMAATGPLTATGEVSVGQPIGEDTGDVTYPLHLISGRAPEDPLVVEARPGDRLRLRLINAGADTAYRFAIGGHRLRIVASDGFPVQPVDVDTVLLGMGERYDVLVTAGDGAVPILSRPEGKSGPDAFAVLRTSPASRTPRAVAQELDGRLLTYGDLMPTDDVALDPRTPDRTLDVVLEMADGGRQWVINGKTYGEHVPLEVHPDERVRLRFANKSTMFHPMHLHGHTFAVVQGGRPGFKKDSLNVMPSQLVEVDLVADNPGQWLLHCHNAYHGELGMMTVLSYVE